MSNTDNYNFKKPLGTEFFNVVHQNDNWDLADAALKELENSKVKKSGDEMTGNLNVPTINGKKPAYAENITFNPITSGFSPGWTGELRWGITQDGKKEYQIISLEKSSDIVSSGSEFLITLPSSPLNARPTVDCRLLTVGYNVSNAKINGSVVEIVVAKNGAVFVGNNGQVTSGVRKINENQFGGS